LSSPPSSALVTRGCLIDDSIDGWIDWSERIAELIAHVTHVVTKPRVKAGRKGESLRSLHLVPAPRKGSKPLGVCASDIHRPRNATFGVVHDLDTPRKMT
jgi:hypothetical protein